MGYGKMARQHIAAFRQAGCEFAASCNRSENGNARAQQEEGIPHVFSDYRKMVEEIRPEGIVVTVSFDQIHRVAKDLIPYRIPLLLEKPTGVSLEEHLELGALAARHGTSVQVGLNRRHYTVVAKAIDDAGGIEAIESVSVEWSERPGYLLAEKGYTEKQVQCVLVGNSIHGIDLMLHLAGSPAAHVLHTRNLGSPYRWLMNVSGISKRGALFQFSSSWDYPVPWRLVLGARRKRYVFAPLETCAVFEEGKKEPRSIEPSPEDGKFKAGFCDQAISFIKLLEGGSNAHGLESATASMRLADELTRKLVEAC